jgi:hypothetical protein
MKPPPVVGARNHFQSTREMAELAVGRLKLEEPWVWDDAMRARFLEWLTGYSNRLVDWIADNFTTGAQRGIEQTAHLLQNPDYYETLKRRRERGRERMKAEQESQEREREERAQGGYTAAEIQSERESLEEQIRYHASCSAQLRARLEALPTNPKLVRFTDLAKQSKNWTVSVNGVRHPADPNDAS